MLSQWHFQHSRSDNSLFYAWNSGHITIVLVYVDDIIITDSASYSEYASDFYFKGSGGT